MKTLYLAPILSLFGISFLIYGLFFYKFNASPPPSKYSAGAIWFDYLTEHGACITSKEEREQFPVLRFLRLHEPRKKAEKYWSENFSASTEYINILRKALLVEENAGLRGLMQDILGKEKEDKEKRGAEKEDKAHLIEWFRNPYYFGDEKVRDEFYEFFDSNISTFSTFILDTLLRAIVGIDKNDAEREIKEDSDDTATAEREDREDSEKEEGEGKEGRDVPKGPKETETFQLKVFCADNATRFKDALDANWDRLEPIAVATCGDIYEERGDALKEKLKKNLDHLNAVIVGAFTSEFLYFYRLHYMFSKDAKKNLLSVMKEQSIDKNLISKVENDESLQKIVQKVVKKTFDGILKRIKGGQRINFNKKWVDVKTKHTEEISKDENAFKEDFRELARVNSSAPWFVPSIREYYKDPSEKGDYSLFEEDLCYYLNYRGISLLRNEQVKTEIEEKFLRNLFKELKLDKVDMSEYKTEGQELITCDPEFRPEGYLYLARHIVKIQSFWKVAPVKLSIWDYLGRGTEEWLDPVIERDLRAKGEPVTKEQKVVCEVDIYFLPINHAVEGVDVLTKTLLDRPAAKADFFTLATKREDMVKFLQKNKKMKFVYLTTATIGGKGSGGSRSGGGEGRIDDFTFTSVNGNPLETKDKILEKVFPTFYKGKERDIRLRIDLKEGIEGGAEPIRKGDRFSEERNFEFSITDVQGNLYMMLFIARKPGSASIGNEIGPDFFDTKKLQGMLKNRHPILQRSKIFFSYSNPAGAQQSSMDYDIYSGEM